MRKVLIDPDGTFTSYLGVIVQHPTGVEYEHQCAGIECAERSVEGYYVPLGGAMMDLDDGNVNASELHQVFHREVRVGCPFGGTAWKEHASALPADRLKDLRDALAKIPYWGREDGPEGQRRTALRLDESRIGDLREAWVPVSTPDGPAILIWPNCD